MMRLLIAALFALLPVAADAACRPGIYGEGSDLVILGAAVPGADSQRWL